MSGSRRWFRYVSDNGFSYSVELDESNAETVFQGVDGVSKKLFLSRVAVYPLLPKWIEMRYMNCYDYYFFDRKKRYFIGDPSLVPTILIPGGYMTTQYNPTGVLPGLYHVPTSYIGEKHKMPPRLADQKEYDSGLIDGDAD